MHTSARLTLVYNASEFRPEDWLRFVHLTTFSQDWSKLGLNDDDLRALEVCIMAAPTRPPVIPGGGGLRKVRFARQGRNRGKSGGYRVFYAYFAEYSIVAFVAVLDKGDRSNLSKADLNAIADVIREIQSLLDKGTIR